MRPAPRAKRPACTAWRIAPAIATGSWARETALATMTASQPSSIAKRGVRGGADAGVQNHRHLDGFPDQSDVVGVADAHAASDRGAQRHHGGAADVGQAPREDGVVGRVGQDREALVDQLLGG